MTHAQNVIAMCERIKAIPLVPDEAAIARMNERVEHYRREDQARLERYRADVEAARG